SKLLCDEEFFRLTRRKRDGVVSYVKRAATMSGGKRTVTVKIYQQPLAKARREDYIRREEENKNENLRRV
ncbi:MAG: hypothetical protein IJG80_01885, partial [Selenomonadaceae bacterium]|nr:hypothetical protein [Selenomonadaceae bacterium]